ncbi:hypothetical protein C7S18_18780 [Ahniella affigens]|uniref:DUF11 domain-containing protein n=1 Tax=Ahniella affigens TaxID=2021234 RepID=A0A2P1PW78_9GAMM|nr:DUF11 domain-containing protein [Ahniella affigens]AVP99086.1 hypothetical protein C7S18_18780 [Ahniella affigens]
MKHRAVLTLKLNLLLSAMLLAAHGSVIAAPSASVPVAAPLPAETAGTGQWRVLFLGGAAPRQAMPGANQALAQAVIDWMESPEVLVLARNQTQLEAKSVLALLNTLPEATQTYRVVETDPAQPVVLAHATLDVVATDSGLQIQPATGAAVLLPFANAPTAMPALHWQRGQDSEQGLRLPLRAAEGDYTTVQAGKAASTEWLAVNRALLAQSERLQVQAMHLNVGWPKAVATGSSTGFAEHDPLLITIAPGLVGELAPALSKTGAVDLFIDGQVQPAPQIPVGDDYDIAVRLRNLGSADATNVTMTAHLDPSMRFVSVTPPPGWTCPVQPQAGDPSGLLTCATPSFVAGADQTLMVRQHVPLTVASGSESYPGFEISGAEPDSNPNNNVDEPGMLAVSQANLGISAQYTAFPLVQGQSVGIIYQIQNFGPHSAIDLTATLTIPPSLGFQGVFPAAGWTCPTTPAPDGSGQIVCTRTQMAVGTEQITVQARVRDDAVTGGEIVVAGAIGSAISEDDFQDNNVVERSTVVREREADVSLALNPLPAAEAEGTIELSFNARNQGIDPAQNPTVTMSYPAGTHFQSINAVGWTCETSPTLVCQRNSLPVDGLSELLVTLSIDADRHNSVIDGAAMISSDWQDPEPANNALPFSIAVKPDADLSVELGATNAVIGQTMVYTLQLSNAGPDTISNAIVTFQAPSNLTFESALIPIGWVCNIPAVGTHGPVSCTTPSFAQDQLSVIMSWTVDPATPVGAPLASQASISAQSYRELNDLQNSAASVALAQSDVLVSNSFE